MKWAPAAAIVPALVVGMAGASLTLRRAEGQSSTAPSISVDAAGAFRVPENYRTDYQYLGTWAVAADGDKGSKQLHVVYASPGAAASYRKGGVFPDGTILVKEVFKTDTAPMTTGTVSRAQTLEGWFVMIKDSNNSRSASKLWGDGWGWSWFDGKDPLKTTSKDYKVDCQGCHVPAKATDWIYTRGYPVLATTR